MKKEEAVASLHNIQGVLCPECGLLHPVPENGICPVANHDKTKDVKNKILQHTNNNNNEITKKDIEIMKLKNCVNKIVSTQYNSMKFSDEYAESKFFKIINNYLENEFKDFITTLK